MIKHETQYKTQKRQKFSIEELKNSKENDNEKQRKEKKTRKIESEMWELRVWDEFNNDKKQRINERIGEFVRKYEKIKVDA